MSKNVPTPFVFAHRGASLIAPENTLKAFELAIQLGTHGIELDAKLTADRQVVVIHDQTVDRTTNGTGKVRELSLSEISRLDAGVRFNQAFKGEMVPTLRAVLTALGSLTYTNVELTNYASPFDPLPILVGKLVAELKLHDRVVFSSFNPIALWQIHRILPGSPISLLALPGRKGSLARSFLGGLMPHSGLNVEKTDATPALIQRTHQAEKKIMVYTVNNEAEMVKLYSLGIDGIFTDDPALALSLLKRSPTLPQI